MKRILALNIPPYIEPLINKIKEALTADIIYANSAIAAAKELKEKEFSAAIIAFHPQENPETSMGISTGPEMWRRILRNAEERLRTIPIIIAVESNFFTTTIEMQMKRYNILNPYIILTGKEFSEEKLNGVLSHLGSG
ncbi:MAG TPA: hypothetical protein VII00_02700 [bacterium]